MTIQCCILNCVELEILLDSLGKHVALSSWDCCTQTIINILCSGQFVGICLSYFRSQLICRIGSSNLHVKRGQICRPFVDGSFSGVSLDKLQQYFQRSFVLKYKTLVLMCNYVILGLCPMYTISPQKSVLPTF